jgi:hypothetical protein
MWYNSTSAFANVFKSEIEVKRSCEWELVAAGSEGNWFKVTQAEEQAICQPSDGTLAIGTGQT